MTMQAFYLPGTDPCRNLAVEEYLLHNGTQDCLLFWRNDNTIVVGRNQNAAEEINRDYVQAHGIRVVRRISGGGAVYHDLNNLNFSFITGGRTSRSIAEFSRTMAKALQGMGIAAEVSGRNDLLVDGAKVSGNAQALYKGRILHHGTLLFDVNLDVLAACLKVRAEKYQGRATRSVRSRVTNLKVHWPGGGTVEEFTQALLAHLAPQKGGAELALSPQAEEVVCRLEKEKYASREWTYGKTLPAADGHTLCHVRKFVGGILEADLEVEGGIIRSCRLFGDFMARLGVEPVARALAGVALEAKALHAALEPFALEDYFGGINRDEIVHCVLGLAEGEDREAAEAGALPDKTAFRQGSAL